MEDDLTPRKPGEFPARTFLNRPQAEDQGRKVPKRRRTEETAPETSPKVSELELVLDDLKILKEVEEEQKKRMDRIREFTQGSERRRALVDAYLALEAPELAGRIFPYRGRQLTGEGAQETGVEKGKKPEEKGKRKFPEGRRERQKVQKEKYGYLLEMFGDGSRQEKDEKASEFLKRQIRIRELYREETPEAERELEKEEGVLRREVEELEARKEREVRQGRAPV